jgi:hypothetical protein
MCRLTRWKHDHGLSADGLGGGAGANQVPVVNWIERTAKANFFPHRIAPLWMILADENNSSAKK